ncbi:MAG: pimeloyl-ACP methyl ester carboxylesterase [Hyphomicrobiaceae bacterium]
MTNSDRVPRSLYPFDGRRTSIGGHGYHYLDEGSGETLVMVHGNPTWSFYYRNLVSAFRDQYRTLVPDHIGCGFSDKPDDAHYSYTLGQRVDDLEEFLDTVDAGDSLTLVLHDWGGMIGMAYAVRHPERIKRLVLMNTAAFHLPAAMSLPAALWSVRNTRLGAYCVQRFNLFARGATWMTTTKRLSKDVRDAYCAPYETYDDRLATLRFVQDIPLKPGDSAYAAVSEVEAGLGLFAKTPALLLWGMTDFVFSPKVLEIFEAHWPQAEVHRFAKAGHYVLEDAADEIPDLIREFLAKHPV